MHARYHKVLFAAAGVGTTAGLIVDADRIDVRDVVAVSRLFPATEARYMRRYYVSPAYPTWAAAFDHVFPVQADGSEARS